MPFGILEIAIVVAIIFVIFGYKRLPGLGRKAGEGVNELRGSVREMVGDKADPKTLGRSAGQGVRELREFRDAVTGKEAPASPDKEAPASSEDEPERVEGEVVRDDRPA